jgi:hypothetical protein
VTTRHVPLCSVDGCPHPDSDEWHRCFVCGKQAVQHQHFPKKSLAGKGAKIVAALCQYHHDKIDKHEWREGVYRHGDGSLRYYVQNLRGEQQCERIIEAAPLEEETLQPVKPVSEVLPAVKADILPAAYLPTSLQIANNLPFEEWQQLGVTLQGMGKSLAWWIGDWLNYGERTYGEKYAQAVEETGIDKGRLANYVWVASRVETSLRNENLSWSHHRMVADLEPNEQREWLQRAQDEGLGASELRAAIKGPAPADVCPETGGKHEWVCKHCGRGKL